MLVLIGITMALVLNLFYDYGSQRKALVENMRYTEESMAKVCAIRGVPVPFIS